MKKKLIKVFTILPEYQKISKQRKRNVLSLLTEWAKQELQKIKKIRFIDNNDGTITDLKTGLMWQKEDDFCERNWNDAIAYAKSLKLAGYSDWRLPSIQELQSLIDFKKASGVYRLYWSASTVSGNTTYAWYTTLSHGATYGNAKTNSTYVRCVRTVKRRPWAL